MGTQVGAMGVVVAGGGDVALAENTIYDGDNNPANPSQHRRQRQPVQKHSTAKASHPGTHRTALKSQA